RRATAPACTRRCPIRTAAASPSRRSPCTAPPTRRCGRGVEIVSSREPLTAIFEPHHLGRAREPGGCSHLLEMIRLFEAVLDHQVQVVALVEDLAAYPAMGLLELAHLPVLLGVELLVHGRDLDEEIVVRESEVGSEPLDRFSIVVELDGERLGLVLPGDAVEVEEEGELDRKSVV